MGKFNPADYVFGALRRYLLTASPWLVPIVVSGLATVSGFAGRFSMAISFLCIILAMFWVLSLVDRVKRRGLLDDSRNLEAIRSLPWQEFELLIAEALRRKGYTVEECGGEQPDNGIDLIARKAGQVLLVQCKRWNKWKVGVEVTREMYGLMVAESANGVMIVTSGHFTEPARDFAKGKPIQLIDREALLDLLGEVRKPEAKSESPAPPPVVALPANDTTSPSQPASFPPCPLCNSEMVIRTNRSDASKKFLGCIDFPRCRGSRPLPR
jgi:restriction system protein